MFIPTRNYPSYFVTLSVYHGAKVFTEKIIIDIIFKSWEFCAKKYKFVIDNYVIMPDHVHFIMHFISDNAKLIKKESIGLRGKYRAISS